MHRRVKSQNEFHDMTDKLSPKPDEGNPRFIVHCENGAEMGAAAGRNHIWFQHIGHVTDPREGYPFPRGLTVFPRPPPALAAAHPASKQNQMES